MVINECYKLKKVIGEGSYGKVVLGRCRITNEDVAIKLIEDISESEYTLVKALRELQILK